MDILVRFQALPMARILGRIPFYFFAGAQCQLANQQGFGQHGGVSER